MELLIRTRPTQGIKIHLCGMEITLPYRWNIYINQLDNIKLLDISGVSYMLSVFFIVLTFNRNFLYLQNVHKSTEVSICRVLCRRVELVAYLGWSVYLILLRDFDAPSFPSLKA